MNKPGYYVVQPRTESWVDGPFETAKEADDKIGEWLSKYDGPLVVQHFDGSKWVKVDI